MKKQKPKFWNSLANRYDRFIEKYANETYKKAIQLIKAELNPTDEILEVGTGTGLIALAVAPAVKSVVAIDSSEGMLNIARQKQSAGKIGNVSFETGDAYNLRLTDNSMDAVICMNIMHLLPNPEMALSEAKRILKSNGKIILPTYCHGENLKSLALSYLSAISGFKVANRWSVKSFHAFLEYQELTIVKEETMPGRIPFSFVVTQNKDVS